jgi:hypothetical protein
LSALDAVSEMLEATDLLGAGGQSRVARPELEAAWRERERERGRGSSLTSVFFKGVVELDGDGRSK